MKPNLNDPAVKTAVDYLTNTYGARICKEITNIFSDGEDMYRREVYPTDPNSFRSMLPCDQWMPRALLETVCISQVLKNVQNLIETKLNKTIGLEFLGVPAEDIEIDDLTWSHIVFDAAFTDVNKTVYLEVEIPLTYDNSYFNDGGDKMVDLLVNKKSWVAMQNPKQYYIRRNGLLKQLVADMIDYFK